MPRILAVLVFVVFTGTTVDAGPARAAGTPERPGTPVPTMDEFVSDLADAGIGVYDLDSTSPVVEVEQPRSPLRLTREQAAAALSGIASGAGIKGGQLDGLVVPPALAPGADPLPASAVVAAWAAEAPTPAADTARELLGAQNLDRYGDVVFPLAVLTLFVADVVPRLDDTGAAEAVTAPRFLPVAAQEVGRASVCEQFQSFINESLTQLFEAIGRLPNVGYYQDGWDWARWLLNRGIDLTNFGLDSVKFIIVEGQRVLLGPLISVVASIASVIAVGAQILLATQPWIADLVPEPLTNQRDGSAKPGAFELTVRAAGPTPEKWPEQLAGCARWANVPLPNLRPSGGDLTWTLDYQSPEQMITLGRVDRTLSESGRATARYMTVVEPPEIARGTLQSDGSVRLTVKVHRTDLEQLRQRLFEALYGQLPAMLRPLEPLIRSVLQPRLERALEPLTTIQDVSTYTILAMTYHTRDDEPTPTPTATPAAGVWVHFDRPAAERVEAGRILELVACEGAYGPWRGFIRTGGLLATATDPFAVPWAELPVRFTIPGAGGRQSARTSATGRVKTPIAAVDVTFRIEVVTDGRTMSVRKLNAPEVEWPAGFERLPIEPAPARLCPR
jgi:hypothetical protein